MIFFIGGHNSNEVIYIAPMHNMSSQDTLQEK